MATSVLNLLFVFILVVSVASGCGSQSEQESAKRPVVIRKKIVMTKQPKPRAAKPGERAAVKIETAKPAVKAQPKAQVLAKKDKDKVSEAKAVPQPASKQVKAQPPSPEKKAAAQPAESAIPLLAKGIGKKSTYFYDPAGKPDPFRALFATDTGQRMVPVKSKVKKPKLPLTPLQRIDLSQLKLVGVIISPTGNKALVEEPSGKGYIISKGTYVGTNFGLVKRILKDRVVVEEEVEDYLSGGTKVRTKELTLYKKAGDV
jgi:type IV pilus assembly protein PilP